MTDQYGFGNPALKGEDSLYRLGLSSRSKNALVRAEVYTVSQVLDLLELDPLERPEIRALGAKGWQEIEEAVERPLLPSFRVARK